MKKHSLLLILAGALILRLVITYNNLHISSFAIQQDNYASYAAALKNGTFNTTKFIETDRQLFPGYPVCIYVILPLINSPIIVGIAISILSSLLVIILMNKLFHNIELTALIAFFPPMWVKQAAKVSTEPIFVLISTFAVLLLMNKKHFLTGFLVGIAFIIRPIGISLLAASILLMLLQKRYTKIPHVISGFLSSLCLLVLYNLMVFGPSNLFYQFAHTSRYNTLRFGLIQIIQDFYRTISWGQYKIFLSGLFYVMTNLVALLTLFFLRKKNRTIQLFFYWHLFTLLFILLPSPFTLLDDFGRYALAAVPAYVVGIYYFLKNSAQYIARFRKLHFK